MSNDTSAGSGAARPEWPLYEVFVRGKRGLNHVHVGSLHAADAEMALHQLARAGDRFSGIEARCGSPLV